MKKILTVIFLLINLNLLSAQSNFFMGAGIIYQTFDKYSYIDNGPLIKGANLYELTIQEPDFEIMMGFKFYKNIFLELDCKTKKYSIGYANNLSIYQYATYSTIKKTIQLPLKIKYLVKLNKKVELYPMAGVVYCHEYNNDSDILFKFENLPEYTTTEVLNSQNNKIFLLGVYGIDLAYNIAKHHSFDFAFNYFNGTKDIILRGINYHLTNNPTNYSAKVFGKGTYFSFGLAYKYKFIKSSSKN